MMTLKITSFSVAYSPPTNPLICYQIFARSNPANFKSTLGPISNRKWSMKNFSNPTTTFLKIGARITLRSEGLVHVKRRKYFIEIRWLYLCAKGNT